MAWTVTAREPRVSAWSRRPGTHRGSSSSPMAFAPRRSPVQTVAHDPHYPEPASHLRHRAGGLAAAMAACGEDRRRRACAGRVPVSPVEPPFVGLRVRARVPTTDRDPVQRGIRRDRAARRHADYLGPRRAGIVGAAFGRLGDRTWMAVLRSRRVGPGRVLLSNDQTHSAPT